MHLKQFRFFNKQIRRLNMENEVKEFDCHSFDAKVWANEFCRMFPNMEKETMLGWFANAIMAGYDYKDNEKRIFKGRRIPDRENFLFDDIKEGDYWFNRKCEMWFAACPAKFPTKEFDLVIANLAGRTITVNKDNTISVKEPILVDCSINRRYVVLYQGTLKNGVWESNNETSLKVENIPTPKGSYESGMASTITKEDRKNVSKFISHLNNLLEEHGANLGTEIFECENGDIKSTICMKFKDWQFDITDEINVNKG